VSCSFSEKLLFGCVVDEVNGLNVACWVSGIACAIAASCGQRRLWIVSNFSTIIASMSANTETTNGTLQSNIPAVLRAHGFSSAGGVERACEVYFLWLFLWQFMHSQITSMGLL
jgi:hypothetical protein